MTAGPDAVNPDAVRRLLDEEEIRQLLARYCHACDHRTDPSFVRDIFTEDATDDHGLFGQVFHGWDELEQLYRKSSEHLDKAAHFVTNVRLQLAGDTATGQSYVQCWTWLKESAEQGPTRPADYVFVGVYDDEFRRTLEGWRLYSRQMKPLGTGALGLGTPHPVYFEAYRTAVYPTGRVGAVAGAEGPPRTCR
ncbi:MAG: nuclear transport factor 2 family protein, partial [Sciscionella sp.]